MVDSPPTIYTSRPDTTLEAELNVLASVYRFILFETNGSDKKVAESAPEPSSRDAAVIVRNRRR